ncbi:hypothetical protein ACV22V_32205 [Burkholderia sp. AW33-5]
MLYDIENIEAFAGLDRDAIAKLPSEYSEDELRGIVAALKFAKRNLDFDYRSFSPDLPYSSGQIYRFLVKIHDSIAYHSELMRE